MNIEYLEPEREEREELFENLFASQFQSSSTSKESLHLNEIFVGLDYQDNALALVIYQPPPPPLGNPKMVATQPTFPFPIPTQQGNQNLKNIPLASLP